MFGTARKLREAGVLGLNERNARFIMALNPRQLYPLVDDKARTKVIALEAGMAVPDLYGMIRNQREVREFGHIVAAHEAFVVKPARGSGGDGILVVASRSQRRRDNFRLASGSLMSTSEIEHHISNIVGGQYSLGGKPDKALIEYCVRFDPTFAEVSFQGVPDVRIVVYRGYPAMAMVRLPTRASDGKANLHKGAVGAGVDMATGRTLTGVLGNDIVDEHPDTGALIEGLEIPGWDFILQSAARGYDVTGLGYLGVDIVIDRDRGPLILEMNARPGLNIQIANRTGLVTRIERIDTLYDARADASERVEVARREFPAERQTPDGG